MSQFYVSNSEESSRMFKSNFFELFSKVHFSVPLFIFIPAISYFFYFGVISDTLSFFDIAAWFALGLGVWTLTEYVMHRWIFHTELPGKIGKRLHFVAHGVHHDFPRDRLRLVLPPALSIPLATLFYFIFTALITGDGFFPFFAAFLLGYLIYDMIHYALHHVQIQGKLWNVLKTHHMKHHYVHPTKGYGVSSPLWDIITGSEFPEDKKVKKA